MLEQLKSGLDIAADQIYLVPGLLDLAELSELAALDRPELKEDPWVPVVPTRFAAGNREALFAELRKSPVLVHHPYDSFARTFEWFVRTAATDPRTLAVKTTVYRTSEDSPHVPALIEAAEEGKQTVSLVELKARFDERRNIEWSRKLESAGVHVVYGFPSLKIHAKGTLIVRRETDGGLRRYAHIGTGNYNAATGRVYTDLGLVTARPSIVEDVSNVFNYLTGYSHQVDYNDLLVAPVNLRRRLRELFAREASHAQDGRPARIIIKVNGLTDNDMIQHLYRASQAGVTVDLLVRGICCLRPGVPGVSDRITVRSVVGRFLEHSRVFWFENGGAPQVFIASADLMERNLDRRVEVLCPIADPALQAYLRENVLELYLGDTQRAWTLGSSGDYTPPAGAGTDQTACDAQAALLLRHTVDYQHD